MTFKDRVCVITGGAAGIGRCISQEFSKRGAMVAIIDKDEAMGTKTLAYIKDNGGGGLFFCGDIAEESVLREFSNTVIKAYGKIDFLINNACLSKKGILSNCSYDDFNYCLRVGISAPYILTQLFLPYFTKDGAIVNISSTRASMSQSDTESYTAAKGGISALTHALSVSLSHKVRVNSISPGWIDTGAYHSEGYIPNYSDGDISQHPSGRVGVPMDILRAVLFLCNPENSFINGENLTVDGGMTRLMIYHDDKGWEYRG